MTLLKRLSARNKDARWARDLRLLTSVLDEYMEAESLGEYGGGAV
jgi:hypothetical protein